MQELFSWTKQWYPLGIVSSLDPKMPHPVELLGERLVLWRDGKGQWRCFEDKCPHRLAPLSGARLLSMLMQACACRAARMKLSMPDFPMPAAEGRIEPSDGSLMCSYHGWRFSGEGKCTTVPQALDAKANAAACASPRSCAVARPTKVRAATCVLLVPTCLASEMAHGAHGKPTAADLGCTAAISA
jgi:phenylpropionate dioxygenase-like ring-hydroxylating dioxygenase large terminal subunit